MFIVRFIILALLVAYGWGMGQIPPGGLNGFGKFISASFFITAPALYFLPTIEASLNGRPNISQIAIINAFLGWTGIGWIVALAMAFKKQETVAIAQGPVATPSQEESHAKAQTRKCPFCAEDIKLEAIKCKHCGSDLKPVDQPAAT